MSRPIPATLRKHAAKIDEVEDARGVQNGWWVYLKPGWIYDGVHSIHEDTLKECADRLGWSDACDCAECKELIAKNSKDAQKDPAAVALGRKGGLVSGIAKGFASLTPEQRAEMGRKFGRKACTCGTCPTCVRRAQRKKGEAK